MTYPTKSVRELGPQYHAGSLPQNMKGLGQCWTRDGSTKNAEWVWFVLYGMFKQEGCWEYILEQMFLTTLFERLLRCCSDLGLALVCLCFDHFLSWLLVGVGHWVEMQLVPSSMLMFLWWWGFIAPEIFGIFSTLLLTHSWFPSWKFSSIFDFNSNYIIG